MIWANNVTLNNSRCTWLLPYKNVVDITSKYMTNLNIMSISTVKMKSDTKEMSDFNFMTPQLKVGPSL